MSAGIIWYKTQPDSKRSSAVSDLLSDYCGAVRSHDVTVRPERLGQIISGIFQRCENVIIIGGMECQRQADNILFILSRVLDIGLEEKYRSRSRYCYNRLKSLRLPSLCGSVLFPVGQGFPEGILLTAGEQHIIVLPAELNGLISASVSMREYFIPEVARRRRESSPRPKDDGPEQRDFEKFKRRRKHAPVTREYDEYQLIRTMERASGRAAMNSDDDTAFDYMYDDQNRGYK
jgi:hypothetical protein